MGFGKCTDIPSEVVHAELVVEDLLTREVVLSLQTGSVLGDIECRMVVPVTEPLDEFPEALRIRSQPDGLGLGTNPFSSLVLIPDFEVANEVIEFRLGVLVLDVVGTVVVHTVEVIASLDESSIFWSELRQPVAQLLSHRVWVLAEVHGVREPGDGELDLAIAGLNVTGVFGIPRLSPISYSSISVSFVRFGESIIIDCR